MKKLAYVLVASLVGAAGVSVGAAPNDLKIQLKLAVWGADAEEVKRLLDAGADPNVPIVDGVTHLMEAASDGNVEIVQRLLDAGANVDASSDADVTALMEAAMKGNADVGKQLLDAGANPFVKNNAGKTALNMAKNQRVIDLLEEAMKKGSQ